MRTRSLKLYFFSLSVYCYICLNTLCTQISILSNQTIISFFSWIISDTSNSRARDIIKTSMNSRRVCGVSPIPQVYPYLIFTWTLSIFRTDEALCRSFCYRVFSSWARIAHPVFLFFSNIAKPKVDWKFLQQRGLSLFKSVKNIYIIDIAWCHCIFYIRSTRLIDKCDSLKLSYSICYSYICISNNFGSRACTWSCYCENWGWISCHNLSIVVNESKF